MSSVGIVLSILLAETREVSSRSVSVGVKGMLLRFRSFRSTAWLSDESKGDCFESTRGSSVSKAGVSV
jgi:hypothetical protein